MEALDSFLFHLVNLPKDSSAVSFPDYRLFLLGALSVVVTLRLPDGVRELLFE